MGLTNMLQDPGTRDKLQDFSERYDEGAPWEGISDEEALENHDQVAAQLDDNEYEESARQSFERLEPAQRREAARSLNAGDTDDPAELAKATTQVHKEQPDMLAQLMSNPAIKGAVAGIAANAAKRFL